MKPEPKRKAMPPEERKRLILDAALIVFVEKGFASARIEDIARRAGVGKGTVYLHFPDKESLFRALVSADLGPVIEGARQLVFGSDMPSRALLDALYAKLEQDVLNTTKSDLLRLMITELSAFPSVTKQYYHDLVGPGLDLIRTILERAESRGELRSRAVLAVPQIVIAPAVMTVLWNILFSRFATFETRAAFDFYLDALFVSPEGETA
ncbi:TetR/AcrR family transcriptional regulator [Martelella soudanensis]|uniref:TetR/AcrR family transcriptional regulator n=1 Tax=unclassified Martelella TaxID=2629616 RepID=UPI0015DDA0F9|nr:MULTISPECIES: TetR/AcrR family transcriptional regulator [unclassified Martelella]